MLSVVYLVMFAFSSSNGLACDCPYPYSGDVCDVIDYCVDIDCINGDCVAEDSGKTVVALTIHM